MDGLLSLLLFAGLFLLMMRFGCGAHVMHGAHKHSHSGGKEDDRVDHTDPVCGIHVDPNAGYAKVVNGHLHRFCSRKCLDRFEQDSNRYLTTSSNGGSA